jgi:hypothetical protein
MDLLTLRVKCPVLYRGVNMAVLIKASPAAGQTLAVRRVFILVYYNDPSCQTTPIFIVSKTKKTPYTVYIPRAGMSGGETAFLGLKIGPILCKIAMDLLKIAPDLRKITVDLPKIDPDLRKIAADLPKIAADLRKIAVDLPKIAVDLPKIAAGLRKIAADLLKITVTLPGTACGLIDAAVNFTAVIYG